ncbi:hypothetical protein ACFPAF_02570 [Hymenobacter endophyticus]|uniref:Outer membrane protein beta-barrel domain-containing protein n=1 Tax=Hymenobacter endophyticus TaxID=3076335 RepID=A0ABU3TD18_9BACT|nr:hypothetical protein [Hymenobacter endophyticus]MDU0369266.1 hypothetical protein [Hymenobacter endophyticus]
MKRTFTSLSLLCAALRFSGTAAAQDTAGWKFYFEAGPKITDFRTTSYGGTYSPQSGSTYFSEEDRRVSVRNTFSAFMDVKAFRPLSERLVLSGTVGLDMQHLNYRTGYTQTTSNSVVTAYGNEHISRLLTRARADFGLHYQVRLGESGRLLPGVSVGQMVNLSKDGYSYTFIQPGLYFTNDRLLLSATVSDTPYNVLIPGASHFEGELQGPYTYDAEYRIREFQLSVGAKF